VDRASSESILGYKDRDGTTGADDSMRIATLKGGLNASSRLSGSIHVNGAWIISTESRSGRAPCRGDDGDD
jgi:hypothetical protein